MIRCGIVNILHLHTCTLCGIISPQSDESQYRDGQSAPPSQVVSPAPMMDIHIPQVQVYSPDSATTPPTQLVSPPPHSPPSDSHGSSHHHTPGMANGDCSTGVIGEEEEEDDEGKGEEEANMDNNLHQIEHCLACTKVRTRSMESQEGTCMHYL